MNETENDYKENYEEVIASNGNRYFLGLVLDNNKKITRAYACGLKDGITPYCIEGTTDGSKHTSNVNLLQSEDLWNGTCTSNSTEAYCTNIYTVLSRTNGDANVGSGCGVFHDGTMGCE